VGVCLGLHRTAPQLKPGSCKNCKIVRRLRFAFVFMCLAIQSYILRILQVSANSLPGRRYLPRAS
jgi:hypothetical protein